MFEKFNTQALYVAIPAVLSLCASGRTTGIVVDCGGGVSNIVPVYEGYSLPYATSRCSVAGCDLTEYLTKLLEREGVSFTTIADTDKECVVRDIKEKLCYVAEDITHEKQRIKSSPETSTWELPDGAVITLSEERFLCPEALFQPSLLGPGSVLHYDKGIHENIIESVTKCDANIRADMLANIVLSGGSTKFTGFAERIRKELDKAVSSSPTSARIKIDKRTTEYSAWTGGSALASFLTSQCMWITRQEYEESGTIIVHQKCF